MKPMNALRTGRLSEIRRCKRRAAAETHPYAVAAAVAIGALAVSALLNRHLAKKAELDNPPAGQFLEIDGVRLHYVERGSPENRSYFSTATAA